MLNYELRSLISTHKLPPLARFLQDLKRRHLIANTHPHFPFNDQDMAAYSAALPNVVYAGVDPTSNSLHIGNLLVLTSLIRSSLFGCSSIALIGGATAIVGDPSGHNTAIFDRQQLLPEVINENAKSLRVQIERLVMNANSTYGEGKVAMQISNNLDWYKEMSMLDFLSASKRFRVSEMLRSGPVNSRIEAGITLSFSEFTYQIMQAYDWFMLSQKYNCYCQIGGSDQLGNFKAGFEHIRAKKERQSVAICLPLITDGYGEKLGKSTTQKDGTGFWLDKLKTSPFAFYQYFRQLHDDIAEKLLIQFSLREIEHVECITENHNKNLGKWIAQTELAEELTLLVHGKEGLEIAKRCSRVLFEGTIGEFTELDADIIKGLFGPASTYSISRGSIRTIGELAELTREGGSKQMKTGALKINGVKYTDPLANIDLDKCLVKDQFSLICWGKRKFSLVHWIE